MKKISLKRAGWLTRNFLNLCVACVRIFIYCLLHPKRFTKLAFSLFSTINEFYQFTHGRLYNFNKTKTCRDLKEKKIFAHCNFYNADSKVARPVETQVLSALTRYFNPRTIFEIGTYNGFSTFHFAYNSSPETKIYTLDLPPDYNLVQNSINKQKNYSYDDMLVVQLSKEMMDKRIYRGSPQEKKIVELLGDSMHYDFSPYYGKMDLIFIDGCHAYPFVRSDTENAFKMLSERGVILWHDFDYIIHRDVFKYLNNLVKDYKIYSIPYTRFAIYGKSLE